MTMSLYFFPDLGAVAVLEGFVFFDLRALPVLEGFG
jgi:hypothetical protein